METKCPDCQETEDIEFLGVSKPQGENFPFKNCWRCKKCDTTFYIDITREQIEDFK